MTNWFSETPTTVMSNLGFSTEKKKLSNLLDFADGRIGLWYYLALMPPEMRSEYGEEWVNIILGPVAATLKIRNQGFDHRFNVINESGLVMLFEAMSLGLIPPGMRKALYEALIARFNAEFVERVRDEHGGEQAARIVFYGILADVLAPIFEEAGADELTAMIARVLEANPKQAGEAKSDPKIVGWIMGQVMRSSPTKLDPNTVRAAILEAL